VNGCNCAFRDPHSAINRRHRRTGHLVQNRDTSIAALEEAELLSWFAPST
jgi:hypothetical protein